jgi:hypothetical protein
MSIVDMLESVQYVVDSKGQQTAVQIDLKTWHMLRDMLEDLDDMAEMARTRAEQEETFAWEDVVAEYQQVHGLAVDAKHCAEDHLAQAAQALLADYETDPALTTFTALDSAPFGGIESC